MTQTATTHQHIVVAGMDQTIEMVIKGGMKIKTIELTGTSAKFEIEYTALSLKMKTAQGEMDSDGDTTNQANKMMGKAIRLMIGKKFNFTLTKNGTVESVDNLENLWSAFTGSDAGMTQMKSSLELSFGKNSVKRSLENVFVYYPDNKIQVGAVWKSTSSAGMNMPLQIANDWSLQSVTGPTSVIISDGQISTTDSTKVINPQPGLRATTNLKGRQVVKSVVSTTHGWPESAKSYSEIKGQMILLAGGQIPEDMPMQMEIKADTEYTLTKK